MLQRGIETSDMDVRWVSSLSWYFLNWFGLNGLYRVILGGDNGMCSQIYIFLHFTLIPVQPPVTSETSLPPPLPQLVEHPLANHKIITSSSLPKQRVSSSPRAFTNGSGMESKSVYFTSTAKPLHDYPGSGFRVDILYELILLNPFCPRARLETTVFL
jgi:hypothetical protein